MGEEDYECPDCGAPLDVLYERPEFDPTLVTGWCTGDCEESKAVPKDGEDERKPEKWERHEREAANIIGRVRGSGNVEKVDAYSNHDPFGFADVIAVGDGKVLFVQVKTNRFTAEHRRKYRKRMRRLDFDHARFEVWVRVDREGWRMHRYDPETEAFEQYIEMDTCDEEATVEAYREAVGYYDEREVATDGSGDPPDEGKREWPSDEAFDGTEVWATKKGANYHDDPDCRHLDGRTPIGYDKSAAWYKGYDPCGDCSTCPEHCVRADGGTDYRQSTPCDEHRQTLADASPRGDAYMDDRSMLACAYDGLALRAELYSEADVEHYREETTATVVLTPAGECQIEGNCRTDPREPSDLERLEGRSIVEAVARCTASRALRISGQRQPYGGPDWFQSEGYPIREAMHRHTTYAVLRALRAEAGRQADLTEFQSHE